MTPTSRLYETNLVLPLVPHLTLLWHAVEPRPPEYWYAYDLHLLRRCDAVLRLPGASRGADVETAEAASLGIPGFDDEASLLAWAEAWAGGWAEAQDKRRPAQREPGPGA